MACLQLEVLNTLERNDPSGSHHCVALVEWFDYRGHVCMVGVDMPSGCTHAERCSSLQFKWHHGMWQALCGAP